MPGVVSVIATPPTPDAAPENLDVLRGLERRVLWLSTAIVHHANDARSKGSGVKVGGHQASTASMVSIMTALWFGHLRAQDRVSVKPHAAPALHAINYLLGGLDRSYLPRLRELGGLQAYPSRTKDPDRVDYSTGSVGIGATQTIWGAIAHRYVAGHFDVPVGGRQIALLGDAELDEGAVWEAIVDPMVPSLGELLWIVDLNRQSLDRVVPGIAHGRLTAMFEAAGWHTVTVKYGALLRALFERDGGSALRRRLDGMSNEEYQHMLRSDPAAVREGLPGPGRGARAIRRLVAELEDGELMAAIRDLGGHDMGGLLEAYEQADRIGDRPSVVLAYTIKGWGLPIEGHPSNHSALLTPDQLGALAEALGADVGAPWAELPAESPEAELCRKVAQRLAPAPSEVRESPPLPVELSLAHRGRLSTQQVFGRLFTALAHEAPDAARRVVTVSPDVASSTNLGGWINRAGVWAIGERIDWFADDPETLIRWRQHDHGRHIELGIAEVNLVGLLAELGSTWSRDGEPLLPVGTIYDPFVCRALEPWSFGIYSGGQSLLVGTPSGVSLAPEGGAHQSIVTPSIGLEQPGCTAWEPAFAQDLEWCLLHALSRLGRADGTSGYLRLTTRPIDQALAALPADEAGRDARRRDVLAGGYRLHAPGASRLTLVAVGAVVPEALEAVRALEEDAGVAATLVCLTSPQLVLEGLRARRGHGPGDGSLPERLFPQGATGPVLAVLDGHPHTLGFLAEVAEGGFASLGVSDFGQSGELDDVYRLHGIDTETLVGTALDLLEDSVVE